MSITPEDFNYQSERKKEVPSLINPPSDSLDTSIHDSRISEPEKRGESGTPPLVKFLFVTVIIGAIFLFAFLRDAIESKKSLERELASLNDQYNQEQQNKKEIEEKYNRIQNYITNTTFRVGEDRFYVNGYDSGYRMFFHVYKKIHLKSLYVMPKESGRIKIILCDTSNNRLQESDPIECTNPEAWQKVNLNFKIDNGQYYLMFESADVKLCWNSSSNARYPYKIKDIIEITGCDIGNNYSRTEYYQYFYDWEFSLPYN
ncbi:MAG: hypothetical protein ACM3SY_09985 [Candidatus Omnitrophota bacterium]